MDWLATIFTWLGNFFSHKQEKAEQQAAADHISVQEQATQIEDMTHAENIRDSIAAADHDQLMRDSEPYTGIDPICTDTRRITLGRQDALTDKTRAQIVAFDQFRDKKGCGV